MISFPSQKPYYIKCIYMDARDTPFTLITLIAKSCITLSIYCLTFLWKAFKLTSLCSVSLIYFYELYHQLIHTGEKSSQCDKWLLPSLPANVCKELHTISIYCLTFLRKAIKTHFTMLSELNLFLWTISSTNTYRRKAFSVW